MLFTPVAGVLPGAKDGLSVGVCVVGASVGNEVGERVKPWAANASTAHSLSPHHTLLPASAAKHFAFVL